MIGQGADNAQNKGQPHHRASHTTPLYCNTEAAFIDAMAAAKCAPSDTSVIVADGVLHRYRVDGDKPNTKNGWFLLFSDGIPSGAFGSWKHGINQTWCAKSKNELSHAERAEHNRRVAAARQAAEALQRQKHMDAAAKAVHLWSQSKPANNNHPYLVKKGIAPGFARQMNDALVLKIQDMNGAIVGLQFIGADGQKRMLSGTAKRGNTILVQRRDTGRLLICEGWATGQSLAAMFPTDSVVSAIDAGNLQPVAIEFSKRSPDGEIVVCADCDEVGRKAGRTAAIACGGKLMLPSFPDDAPEQLSDFNDLQQWRDRK